MPYAAEGKISTEFFEGSIQITKAQYALALEGMMAGRVVSTRRGFGVVDTPEPPAPLPTPAPVPGPKLVGVEFDGVMCSATEADQNGLSAVLMAIQFQGAEFPPTRFYFANGNTLVITLANYQAFAATWLPFRQSFFQP